MAHFPLPAKTANSALSIDSFLGVDFTNHPSNIDKRRSCGAKNMVRDVPGKVRKRMGYEEEAVYTARINGAHFLKGGNSLLIHAGSGLYSGQTLLYTGLADERSLSFQMEERLCIADGAQLLLYDGQAVTPAKENATIPLFTVARAPSGGGTALDALNLLQPKFTERFLGTAQDQVYQLSFAPLDSAAAEVQLLQQDGSWRTLSVETDFSVNAATGAVTFITPPGTSPLDGEDNVSITAARTVEGYAQRIDGCTVGALFGVNGAQDRLFLSGNPLYPNYDWHCALSDPTYFADVDYAALGQRSSSIMGYSVLNDRLVTYKDGAEQQGNAVLRSGILQDGKAAFPVVNTLQGCGAAGKYAQGYLSAEPLFLTSLGVYAITPADITGEIYLQNRSFYLNGKLLQEEGLEDAYACIFRDMYWLCLNGKAYILDGLQPQPPANGMPYSTRQYAGFYCTNIPARIMFQWAGRLYFGSEEGELFRFFDDPEALLSYSDNGAPIKARWELPDIEGAAFYKNKTFRYLAVQLASAAVTGVDIYAMEKGLWRLLRSEENKPRYFSWSNLSWPSFTWSNDSTSKLAACKIRIKKTEKVRFAFENAQLNQPFGLFSVAMEYREGANRK